VSIFNDCLPEAVRLTEQPNPLVTAELIGHASAVIGSSLHIGITALAFGVPVFRPGKTFNGKYAILADYNTVYTFDYISEIDPDWFAAKLGKAAPSALVKETLQQLSKHWDRVANILTNEGKNADNVETLGNFWQSMPGLLKTWSDRYESAVQEYDSLRAEYQAFQAERKAIYNSNSWKITAPLRSISTMLKKFNPNKKG
jgi:lipopolysaccharide transport system ATP-binding protein